MDICGSLSPWRGAMGWRPGGCYKFQDRLDFKYAGWGGQGVVYTTRSSCWTVPTDPFSLR